MQCIVIYRHQRLAEQSCSKMRKAWVKKLRKIKKLTNNNVNSPHHLHNNIITRWSKCSTFAQHFCKYCRLINNHYPESVNNR